MAYTPEQLQKYKDYISQNKSQLDETKFQQLTKDRNALNEFQQTGAIAKTYFKPTQSTTPAIQPTISPTQQPVVTQATQSTTQAPTPVQQDTQVKTLPKATKAPIAPKVEQPKTPTDITYSKDATPYNLKDVVSSAPAFQGAGGKMYQTQRLNDNTLITIDTATGKPVTSRYTDTERDAMKQSLMEDGGQQMQQQAQLEQQRFNTIQKYSSMSDKLLQTSLSEGYLLPGTKEYDALMSDPVQKERLSKIQQINLIGGKTTNTEQVFGIKSEEILNNTSVNIGGQEMTLGQALTDGFIDKAEYDAMTNTPAIIAKYEQLERQQMIVNELQAEYNAIESSIDEEYKGRGLSSTARRKLLANAQDRVRGPLQFEIDNLNAITGTLTQMKKDSSDLFATNLAQYSKQEERAYEKTLTQEERAYNEKQQQSQLEQKYAYEYGDLNSENPTLQNIAIERAVAGMYTKYPLPGMESQALKVQKVKNLMAQGMSGTEAIAQVENEIRNSQRYKDYLAFQKSSMQPAQTQDWAKLDDNTLYNQKTGEIQNADGSITNQYTQDPQAIASFSIQKRGRENLQCGELVNDFILQATGQNPTVRFGNTYNDKIKAIESIGKSNEPIAGGIFVSNPLNNNVGHTGIVQTVNDDGSIEVLEANATGKTTGDVPTLNTYTADQVRNMSFSGSIANKESDTNMQAMALVQGLGGTEGERKTLAENIVSVSKRDGISLQDAKKKLNYKSSDDVEFAKTRKEDYQSIKKSISESTSNAKTALTLLSQPQTAIGDVASIVGFLKTIDPASVARESEVASVENARGILDSLSNVFQKAKEGTKLTDTQRKQLKDSIQTIVTASDNKYNDYVSGLVQEFDDRGLDATVYIPKSEVERVKKRETAKTQPTPQTGGRIVNTTGGRIKK